MRRSHLGATERGQVRGFVPSGSRTSTRWRATFGGWDAYASVPPVASGVEPRAPGDPRSLSRTQLPATRAVRRERSAARSLQTAAGPEIGGGTIVRFEDESRGVLSEMTLAVPAECALSCGAGRRCTNAHTIVSVASCGYRHAVRGGASLRKIMDLQGSGDELENVSRCCSTRCDGGGQALFGPGEALCERAAQRERACSGTAENRRRPRRPLPAHEPPLAR